MSQKAFFLHNLHVRLTDGFTIGYNLVFPIILILLMGTLARGKYTSIVTSYQYYCVVMFPFCLVLSVVTAAYAGKDDAYAKTAERIIASPISVVTIVSSKIISCTITFFVCSTSGLLISSAIWKLPIWRSLISILLFYLCFSVFVSSIGSLIGLSMNNFLLIKNFISVPVTLLAAIAGIFYPIHTSNPIFTKIIEKSPFYLINQSIFATIYDNTCKRLMLLSVVFVVVSMICFVIAVKKFKKEEYIHGIIPGYEK